MITAEKLLDSLESLPNDLIEETDAVRSRKPVPWVKWTALAACACLCIGLWFAFPGAVKSDNAAGTPENGTPNEENIGMLEDKHQSTSSTGSMDAIVYSVGEDHITVTSTVKHPYPDGLDGFCVQMTQTTVTFENLDEIPDLKSGQKIRIYYDEVNEDSSISPYKIEIIDEQEVQQ